MGVWRGSQLFTPTRLRAQNVQRQGAGEHAAGMRESSTIGERELPGPRPNSEPHNYNLPSSELSFIYTYYLPSSVHCLMVTRILYITIKKLVPSAHLLDVHT
jgi:hypothetical protein